MYPLLAARYWLWIDEVGGFVVCTGESVTIGQSPGLLAVDEPLIEVPLQADISRRHATIRRGGEGFWLETAREVSIDGQRVERSAPLGRDSLITLRDVKLRFSQPHPWSLSARLEFVSRHRTQPTCDGVLLVNDTLVLGPRESSHVVCPGWDDELVLAWRQGQWCLPGAGEPWQVDSGPGGVPLPGERPLELPIRLVSPAGAISLTEFSNIRVSRTK